MEPLRFGMLGRLEVWRGGDTLSLGAPKQRAVLARLLVDADRPVEADLLVEDVWQGLPPPAAATSLQSYIARLRRSLEVERPAGAAPAILTTHGSAYQLHVEDLDADRFERLAATVTDHLAASRPADAVVTADEALALWRGEVLADLADLTFTRPVAARLDQRRLSLIEDRAQAAIELGDAAVAEQLEAVVAQHPLRERAWYLLMLALHRAGRTADSLEAYHRLRARLGDDLGLEPGRALRDLQAAILRDDPELVAGSPFPGPRAGVRAASAGETDGSAVPPTAAPLDAPVLPRPATPLIGREDDLTAVATLLGTAARCVTLIGPGGVGKTRLSLEVAHRRAAEGGDVVFVPLAPLRDHRQVLPALASAVGLSESSGSDTEQRLRTVLAGRATLAVLDNLEHVLGAAPSLAALLASCPGLQLLVTSRAPLRIGGEHEHHLSPLAVPDLEDVPAAAHVREAPAAELFVSRAASHAPHFLLTDRNAAAVAAICRRLDGLPLALELAAVWLRMLTPATLLARLDDALPFLSDGARDLPDRQRTMRDVVAWSYDLLAEDEQRLLAELSVFRAGWTLEDAAAVSSRTGTAELYADHARLVEVSLAQRAPSDDPEDEPRFTMLETIRAFAQERLAAEGDAPTVRLRHAHQMTAIAAQAAEGLTGPDQGRWLDRLEERLADLHAAFGWYISDADLEAAAELLWSVRYFLYIRGHLTEGRRWAAVVLGSGSLSDRSRARVLTVDGLLTFVQGAWPAAVAVLDESLQLTDDDETVAFAASVRGHAAIGTGDLDGAARSAELALERYRAVDDRAGLGVTTLVLFHRAAVTGEIDRALALLDEAERHLRVAGGPWGLAFLLNLRVMVAQMSGRGPEALAVQRESLELSRSVRDTAALYFGLTAMAELQVESGELETAARLFGASERLQQRVGTAMQNEVNRSLYEHHLGQLRARLAPADLRRCWDEGRALDLDAAIELALRPGEEATTSVTSPP